MRRGPGVQCYDRTRSKRLERLEARVVPAGDPLVMEIQFVSPEKVMTNTISVEIRQRGHNQGAAAAPPDPKYLPTMSDIRLRMPDLDCAAGKKSGLPIRSVDSIGKLCGVNHW
jgi:hypothetical protein